MKTLYFGKITVIALLLSGLLRGSANSYACTDIRLDNPGKSCENMPVLDQDGTDTCYAYAASILSKAWSQSHGDKSSNFPFPLDLAVQFSLKDPRKTLHSGGNAAQVLTDALNNGVCDPTSGSQLSDAPSQAVSEWLRGRIQEIAKCKEAASVVSDLSAYDATDPKNSAAGDCLFKSGLNTQQIPDLKSVETALGAQSTLDALQKAMAQLCPKEKRHAVGSYSVAYHAMKSPLDLGTDLETQLSQPNPQPMTIGFCSNVLLKGGEGYSGLTWKSGQEPTAQGDCDKHEAVVMGMRKGANGKCQVLVHNSWGTSRYGTSEQWENEGGKIWIDEDVLAKNTLETTHLDPVKAIPVEGGK